MTWRTQSARTMLSVLGVAVLFALLVIALRRLDLAHVAMDMRNADIAWLALATACFIAILPLWALEWWILSPPSPVRTLPRMLGVVAMTSSVLNTAPMLVGEAAGTMFLVLRVGLTSATALSVLAMDQLFVGLAKAAVIVAAALLMPQPRWLSLAWPLFAGGVTVLLLLLLFAARRGDGRSIDGEMIPTRMGAFLTRISHGLRPLRSMRRSASVLVLALAKKGAELLAIICVQRAFGVALAPEVAVLVLAALAVATLLPLLPSNVGVYEAAVVMVYVQAGVSGEQALAMAITQHALFLLCLALPGYPALIAAGAGRSSAAAR